MQGHAAADDEEPGDAQQELAERAIGEGRAETATRDGTGFHATIFRRLAFAGSVRADYKAEGRVTEAAADHRILHRFTAFRAGCGYDDAAMLPDAPAGLGDPGVEDHRRASIGPGYLRNRTVPA